VTGNPSFCMRWVFIDTSAAGECRFGTFGTGKPTIKRVAVRSNGLLPLLERMFGKEKPASIDGIVVVAGPGSFSSVRGGVLVANLLARCWSIQLFGVPVADAEDLGGLSGRLSRDEVPSASFVQPRYTSEPNITMAAPS